MTLSIKVRWLTWVSPSHDITSTILQRWSCMLWIISFLSPHFDFHAPIEINLGLIKSITLYFRTQNLLSSKIPIWPSDSYCCGTTPIFLLLASSLLWYLHPFSSYNVSVIYCCCFPWLTCLMSVRHQYFFFLFRTLHIDVLDMPNMAQIDIYSFLSFKMLALLLFHKKCSLYMIKPQLKPRLVIQSYLMSKQSISKKTPERQETSVSHELHIFPHMVGSNKE